ncbi:uncharacterized protein LOC127786679 isoform X2 [Diospyros lotus]|uniref:uncharacterized protein LOC127786679 isoform X2 n=1 Tax=Diospyros lotus TaxID=55363 RepID=UPI002254555F|nr:uncharacterized protein LOC127786679 isoform X2 [Diospyros lotus]
MATASLSASPRPFLLSSDFIRARTQKPASLSWSSSFPHLNLSINSISNPPNPAFNKLIFHHMVLPVFYGVDPSEVRKQKGDYAEAFVRHEAQFKEGKCEAKKWMEKLKRWREALEEAANLAGMALHNHADGERERERGEKVAKPQKVSSVRFNKDKLHFTQLNACFMQKFWTYVRVFVIRGY